MEKADIDSEMCIDNLHSLIIQGYHNGGNVMVCYTPPAMQQYIRWKTVEFLSFKDRINFHMIWCMHFNTIL